MASASTSNGSKCFTCNKSIGTFTCRGCEQNFCLNHASEHRQMLSIQMDEDIIPLHDQLQESIRQQKSFDHPIIKQIEEWEKNSIELIHQTANHIRIEFGNIIDKYSKELKENLEILTEELKEARNNEQFFENDLKEWTKKLNELNKDLTIPLNINIQYDNNLPSFISKIKLNHVESFQQSIGNINIIENGSLIIHNDTNTYASVCGKRHYIEGEHQLHFKIEHLTNSWAFFGIKSKDADIPDYPSIGKTSYGWSGDNNVWRNGIRSTGFNSYQNDFKINDQIQLTINCDNKTIQLINQRTQTKFILNIDINDCPLPWVLNIGLFHSPGESIRLIL